MLTNFNSQWGDRFSYVCDVVHGNRNPQIGIPTYAFLATALDPCTKKKLSKVLPKQEQLELWRDIVEAIISLIGYLPKNNALQQVVKAPAPLAMVNRLLKNNNIFFADSDDDKRMIMLLVLIPLPIQLRQRSGITMPQRVSLCILLGTISVHLVIPLYGGKHM